MDNSAIVNDNAHMSRALRIVVKPEVQKLLDHFCYSFNIRILLYDPDGQILSVGMDRPDSEFCRMIRSLYGKDRCLTLDDKMRQSAARSRKLVCYKCHAGLTETVEPILVHNTLIGYAMIGQFRSSSRISGQVQAEWSRRFGDDQSIRKAFEALPMVETGGRNHIVGLFRVLVEYVVSKELITPRPRHLVEEVQSFIEHNYNRHLTLGEIASEIGRSESTVSHTFRKHTGQSFQQYYRSMRIAEAERVMATEPSIPLSAVAERLGFSDQFYFSRLYRRERGYPPSQYRKRLTTTASQ